MSIPKTSLALAIFVATALPVGSAGVANLPAIGAHQPILTVEKKVNPANKMVVYSKVDANGRFAADPAKRNRPMLDFYWLMDGRNYKPVNGMIKSEIGKRFIPQWSPDNRGGHFTVDVNDLKEVNSDIRNPKMDIYANATGGGVEAQMNLGPSDGNMRIRLSSIYTEGRAFPPAVESVTLKGEEIVNGSLTGKKVSRRYVAAGRSE